MWRQWKEGVTARLPPPNFLLELGKIWSPCWVFSWVLTKHQVSCGNAFFFEMLFTLLSHLIFLPVIFQSLSHVCDPMNCSMPSFPVLHSPGVCSNSVHRVSDAIQPSHPLSSPSPFAFNLSQHQGLFQWLFALDGQSIGASASVSVLPVNIQGWFPWRLTDLISWQPKSLSRVFSSTTVRRDLYHCLQFADEEIELPGWWFKQPVSNRARRQSSWCKRCTFPPLLLRDGSASIPAGSCHWTHQLGGQRNVDWKELQNLKVENYVLFSRLSENFKPGRQDSQISLSDPSEEVKEKIRYRGVFATKTR